MLYFSTLCLFQNMLLFSHLVLIHNFIFLSKLYSCFLFASFVILNHLFFWPYRMLRFLWFFKQHSITGFNPTNLSFIKYIQPHYNYSKDWKTSCFPFLLLYCLLYIILLFVFFPPIFTGCTIIIHLFSFPN